MKSKTLPTSKVKYRKTNRRPSKYADLIQRVQKITPEQTVTVRVPEGRDALSHQRVLYNVLRNRGIMAPKGYTFRQRQVAGGLIGISLRKK